MPPVCQRSKVSHPHTAVIRCGAVSIIVEGSFDDVKCPAGRTLESAVAPENEAAVGASVDDVLAVVHAERNARTQPTPDEAEYGEDEPGQSSRFVADIGHHLTLTVGTGRLERLDAQRSTHSHGRRHYHHGALLARLSRHWLGCNRLSGIRLRRVRLLRRIWLLRWICGLRWVGSLRLSRWRILGRVNASSFRVGRRRRHDVGDSVHSGLCSTQNTKQYIVNRATKQCEAISTQSYTYRRTSPCTLR